MRSIGEIQRHQDSAHTDGQLMCKVTATDAFTGGLHPYFLIQDFRQMKVAGLHGQAATDRYLPNFRQQDEVFLKLNGTAFERLYDGCPALELWTPDKRLRLDAEGFDQWMVWNPGREGARRLADLPDEDWQKFVCIEPVRVSRPVILQPEEIFRGGLTISVD